MSIKRLDYIYTTGGSRIDLGILCKSSLKVQIGFNMTKVTGYTIIGKYNGDGDCFRLFNYSQQAYLDLGSSSNRISGGTLSINKRYNVEFGNRYVKDIDTGDYLCNGSQVSSFTKNYNLALCGDSDPNCAGYFYFVKVYDDDVLLFDGFPALDDENNVGLYDVVSKKFFKNTGNTQFTYGSIVGDFTRKLYLIRDGVALYTVVDGALSNITGERTIEANLFTEFGIDAIPDSSLLMSLSYPEILCWTDEEELPTLKATVNGLPVGTHEIISDDINLVHPSIYGIIGVTVNASENAMFFISFDGGSWKIYNSISNTWNDSGIGMTGEELSAISSEVWEDVFNSCQYIRIKAIISGSEYVSRVKVNFLNESEV